MAILSTGPINASELYTTTYGGSHTTQQASLRTMSAAWGDTTQDNYSSFRTRNGLLNDLVYYFDFNSTTPNYGLDDLSVNGNDGIEVGSISYNALGKNGNCWYFPGSTSYVRVPDSATLNPATWTLSFWIKPLLQNAARERIWAWPGYDFDIAIDTLYKIYCYDGAWRDTGFTASSSVWTFFTVQMVSGTGWSMRKNLGTAYSRATSRTLSGDLYIGATSSGGENYKGYLDEMGFWSRELTDNDLTALYNSGNGLYFSSFDEP